MKKILTLIIIGLLSFSMFAMLGSQVIAQEVGFQASYSTGPLPLIDGSVTDQEWNDANSYTISLSGVAGTVPATVYFKHDGTNIYIGLKVSDSASLAEFALFFDEGNDGGYGSGTRDGVLTSNQEDLKACWSPSSGYPIEDGCYKSGWYGYFGGGDFAAACVFNVDHWEVEFKIPFAGHDDVGGTPLGDVSDLVCSITDTIGIKIQYFTQPDALNYFYPAGDQAQIATYTTLSFAHSTVSVTPNPAYPNQVVQISGQVTPAATYSLRIDLIDPNGNRQVVGSIYTDTAGHFQMSYVPPGGLGSYSIQVIDVGDINNPVVATTDFDVIMEHGIKVTNIAVGTPPPDAWNYLITDNEGTVLANFTLPAGGGSISFSDPAFIAGGNFLVTATPKFGYYLDISTELHSDYSWSEIVNSTTVLLHLAADDFMGVTFTNTPMPAFAVASVGSTPPSDLNFQISPLTPIPVQAGWSVDINPPSNTLDLVRGKPMAILVNVGATEHTILPNYQITVSVLFESRTYTNVTMGSQILADSIVSVWNQPITPPNNAAPTVPSEPITGTYTIYDPQTSSTIESGSLTPTVVTVKDVPDLSLYYAHLSKSGGQAYGTESQSAYDSMVANSTAFINATYPVKNVTINARYSSNGIGGTNDMLKDATNIATAAKLAFPNSNAVGIGIGPNNTGKPDYFAFQGYPGAAGVSFGPSVKGVIALDGYYTAAAHEVAHTYALYWGVPEQYSVYPLNGKTASGVWASQGQWRTGYSFMGTAPYKTLSFSWVDSDTTYKTLFSSMATNPADPEILVSSGYIYNDGSVVLEPWYHVQQGTPDTLTPGDYALRFVDAQNNILAATSFDASFFMQIDGGVSVGENIGFSALARRVDTDVAGFAFTTAYPQGTAAVQVVNMVDPQNPVVLTTVNAADIKNFPYSFGGFLQPINTDGSSIFKLGSTIPVKFQLKDPQGNYFTTAIAKIYTAKIADGVTGTEVEAVSTSAATTGNLFRYDSTSNQYIFNLSTKSLSKGTWQIKVILDDGTQKTVIISLK